jgi:hypothetical protein
MRFAFLKSALGATPVFILFFLCSTPLRLSALEYYWVGGSGMWSEHDTHWATTSGGNVFHDQVPQSTDNVHFDANSFPSGGTVTIDQTVIYFQDMDWTGVTNNPILVGPSDKKVFIYGSLTLSPIMQWNVYGEVHFLSFHLGNTITSAGKIFGNTVFFNGNGGEWLLMDQFETNGSVEHITGVLRTVNNTLRIGTNWNSNYNNNYVAPELYLGTSFMYFKYGGYANFQYYGQNSLDASTCNIIFESGGALNSNSVNFLNVTFNLNYGQFGGGNILGKLYFESGGTCQGSQSYIHELEFQGQGSFSGYLNRVDKLLFHSLGGVNINPGSTSCFDGGSGNINEFGEVIFLDHGWIYDNNSFESLTFSPGKTYVIGKNSIQTITPLGNFIAQGSGSFPIEIKSCQLGSQATFHKDGDPICLDFLYLTDMVASGTGFSYAGSNSNDVYNNSGWIFSACPACFSAPPIPAPALDPASVTSVQPNQTATLILQNIPAGYKAVWVNEARDMELYASPANIFQPVITKSTRFYGFLRDITSGCISDTLAVVVCAPTVTATGEDISCEGSAQIQLFEQSGQGASWAWTGPGGFSSANQNPVILNPSPAQAGDYIVVMTDAYGCSVSDTVTVQVVNTFSVHALPASCYNGFQYIRFVVNGTGTYQITNNGSGNLSTTTVNGGGWFLLSGLADNASWNITVQKQGVPSICSKTLSGTVGLCISAPNSGCSDPIALTQNNTNFGGTVVSDGDYAAWSDYDGHDYEIYIHNFSNNETTNITDDDNVPEYYPQISGDFVLYENGGSGRFLYKISSHTTMTIPLFYDLYLNGDYVVGNQNSEIFVYRISTGLFTQITNNGLSDDHPKTDGHFVVWRQYDSGLGIYKLFSYDLWNSGPTVLLSGNSGLIGEYTVKNGRVGWVENSGVVKTYNLLLGGPVQVIAGPGEPTSWVLANGDQVVWRSNNGLKIFDQGTGLTQLIPGSTGNASLNDKSLANGKLVWLAPGPFINNYPYTGNDVFCYDIASQAITFIPHSFNDYEPSSNGQYLIWRGSDGNDDEAYLYDLSYLPPAPQLDTALSDTASCHQITLVLSGMQPGQEAVWFGDIAMNSEYYSDVANHFQPSVYGSLTLFGGFRNTTTGCVSKLIQLQLYSPPEPQITCPNSRSANIEPGVCYATQGNLAPLNMNSFCPAALTWEISGATTATGLGSLSSYSFNGGTSTVIYTLTDSTHKSSACAFQVNIYDNEAPVINCPTAQIYTDPGLCYATIPDSSFDATFSDNCNGPFTLNQYYSSPYGTLANKTFSMGITNVQWYVWDGSGNQRSCTQQVQVIDNEPPMVTFCPGSIVVPNYFGLCGNYVNWSNPQFTDNCSYSVNSNYSSGNFFPVGTTLVSYTAADNSGNQSVCSFSVTVEDTESPYLLCDAISLVNSPGTCDGVVVGMQFDPIVADNCGSYTNLQHDNTSANNNSSLNGATFPVGVSTVHWTVEDTAGNTTSCTQTITVNDTEAPQIQNCPQNIAVFNTPGQCNAPAFWTLPTAVDNCTLQDIGSGYTPGDIFPIGQTFVQYVATDIYGNHSYCGFYVEVLDTEAPGLQCQNIILDNDQNLCSKLVSTQFLDAQASDNCFYIMSLTHSFTPSPENVSLAGTNFPVGITQVIWTATDGHGNTGTCLQQVEVRDSQLPTFLNCPTQMLMVGNDVDQCAAKVNWPDPVAWDNCGAPNVMQFSGPLSGTNIPVSPAPDTIKYRATDAAGNSAVCTFLVRVIDTQLPSINANVSIPANTTVDCNAVPPPFVLTANDVHDNCTAPQDIVITYTQTLTQNNNPGTCGFYTFQIIRTWKITDAAGNMRTYTQVISVQDTQKPTAICKDINLTLDDFGNASITPQQLDGGSSDNCTPAANLLFTASKTAFNCAQLGPNVVTFTVTDICGNTSTCTAIVTVLEGNGKCNPTYDVNGSDPCVCLNNASTLTDGQFSELIQIQALAGQTWSVASHTGLFSPNSPNPPNAPLPIPNGALLTNGLNDGLDNDQDGSTDEPDERVYYTLRARHVDAQGYTAVLSAGAGLQLSLGNKCYYPTPYFSNLTDPFCLNTAPFNIAVNELYNAQGTVSIKVNGVTTNTFNAAALGVGFHTVTATFDAGSAQPFSTENGITVNGSDAAAQADPGCQQTISKVVQVVGTPTTVVCNDLVYVSLDADCVETLNADDVLEGTYLCYDDYTVEIDKTLPYGNGPWAPGTVNATDIGKTYVYHVLHPISGNVCWGQIKIEDKLAPALTCPPNITIACSEPTAAQHTGNVTVQDCSTTSTVLDDTYTDFGLCSAPRSQIVRAFIVTDAWGNQSSCSQTITITPFDLATVVFPVDITLNCEITYLNPAALTPINTGRPTINGASILGSVMCGAKVNYTDTYYQGCEGAYTILRVWSVLNDCLPVGPGNPITHTQRIRVDDFGGPVFDCPAAVTVSTDPTQCCATAALPDMIISEGCSHIADLEAKVTGTNPANGNIITFTVSGHLGDFPGNNYWTPDTLAIFPYTQCLPVGVYTVQYTAADQCGNTSKCAFQMTVADLVPPVAACDQWTQVDLGGNGMAFVDAATFDDGSHDNCAPVEFKVRRMQPNDCQLDTLFYDQVKFCCSDIDDTLLLVFRVYDVDVPAGTIGLEAYEGRYNDCMVQVLVKDKIKPTCNPPANVIVDCENFDPSLWAYGTATAEDNCCIDTLTATANYALFDTVCNRGTITRTFRAYDCAGLTNQCTQRVVVNYLQDYYVKFPNDAIVTVCDGTGLFGEPTFFGKDCELLGISFEDQIFTVVPDACFEIERTWKIINWCTFNPNLPLTEVPNPNPNATSGSPQNLPGPIVSAPGTLAPWTATVVKVLPTDPVPTNYSVFWAANTNGYVYKQIIKILDTQDPTAENCPDSLVTFCDVTPNDPQLWRDNFWWDDATALHDLCEGPTDLTITATDACSGSNINIHYLLFLDMDKDGTMETVINSVNTGIAGLGWNAVPFGNAANPNFSGGSIHGFDSRPVLFNQKYGFAIQTTAAGMKKTASVRWNTQQNQNNFVVPELPYGKHKIKWIIEDGCGNESVCEYTFEVKDCKKPSVVCLNGLTVNIMPNGMVTLWDADFLQYADDNCTPADKIKTAIRRSGTGTGFPLDGNGNPVMSVNFTCDDLGTQTVELWGRDLAGNAGYCETYVIVQDNAGNCIADSTAAKVAGQLITETDDGVEEGVVQISGSGTAIPSFTFSTMSSNQGWYNFNAIPRASNSVVTPLKDDNPLNGVSTYDLVLISKHILGVEPLNTPYKMIAADANNSNSITTFDVVELRKLILGIYTDLPTNTSWRFVDKSFVFPNPGNPFQTQFPETKLIADIQSNHLAEDFVSVKVGDVNGTVIPNSIVRADDRNVGNLLFDVNGPTFTRPGESPTPTLPGREGAALGISGADAGLVRAGEIYTVTLTPDQVVAGYQFTLNTKGLEVLNVAGLKGENYAVFADAVTFSVDGQAAQNVIALTFKATKSGKLSEMLSISSRITKVEAYPAYAEASAYPAYAEASALPAYAEASAYPAYAEASAGKGAFDVALRFNVNGTSTISGVGFELYQNQPNPFVNKTVIGFHLPPSPVSPAEARSAQAGATTTVTLSIYDETGRIIFTQTGNFPQGYNAITIDRALLNTTGMLYYKLKTATNSATKKMIQTK